MKQPEQNLAIQVPSELASSPDRMEALNHAKQAYLYNLGKLTPPREFILISPMQVPEPAFDKEIAKRSGYFNYPPVGLLYIAAVIRQVAPETKVHVLDLNFEMLRNASQEDFSYNFWEKQIFDLVEQCQSPYIGISCMFDVNKDIFVQIAQTCKKRFPAIPILAGGVQATYDYKELLENGGFDYIFRKESELQFESFLKNLFQKNHTDLPWGVAFLGEGEALTLGEPSGEVPVDLDIRENYSSIPIEKYHLHGGLAVFSRYNGTEKPFATVLSNRGCRAYCTFCTVRDFNGKGIRARSVESVIDELKFLWGRGVRQIDWLDDDFLWDRQRTLHLLKRMTEEVPDLEWISNNGLIAAAIDEEIMEWLVRSGLKALKVGIESGNDAMLKKIKKPTSKRKLMMASTLFKKYSEVFFSGNFIIGFPNETFGEMIDSYEFARTLNWDWASFYVCQPLVGTEMYSIFRELGDDRVDNQRNHKALNPGRLKQRGEFNAQFDERGERGLLTGEDIFNLPRDQVPTLEQLNEIWFAFNLKINFLNNPNFGPKGNLEKIARWFESIYAGYPFDASMAAALAKSYVMMNDRERSLHYKKRFNEILQESGYWQNRVKEFPEILEMVKT
ncbi:MAG: radical SAM protein [Nitrospinota bacterium]|nr:radical SAM protein [Nitrospinota bacterium]